VSRVTTQNVHLRFALPSDAEAVLGIYAPYVRDTAVTFEYEVPDLSSYTERMERIMASYPFILCEVGQRVVGYAYASRHRDRAAYQWATESSVYIDPEFQGQGLGKRLYAALLEILRHQGFLIVYAVITMPNEASERLHTSVGFSEIGLHRCAGFKLGAWHDVKWYEYFLSDPPAEPQTPMAFPLVRDKKWDFVS